MNIFYDTEFIEDGRTIDLISVGMVAEDGRELYAIAEEVQTDPELRGRIQRHLWLMENVIPHLPLVPGPGGKRFSLPSAGLRAERGRFELDLDDARVLPRQVLRKQVRAFIQATPAAELWAWYGAYDHVALAQLFGPMIALPTGVPMWTNDLKQECVRLGDPSLPRRDGQDDHDALADARWLAQSFAWLANLGQDAAPADSWRVRHPGLGVLTYDSEAAARVAAGTAGEVLPPESTQT